MTMIRAGLYGLCVADALGVPAESRTREDLRRNPITEMVGGGLHQQPAGYWSDDSSMTLCLADSIGKVGYYHTHDIMARFDDWCRNGAYTPGGQKFDIYSGGYVVETMETVLWALMNTDNYRDCVLTCVNMGYDADSTAAIAGGLAGLYYGYDSIPREWVDGLVNKELIEACIKGMEEYVNEL